MSKIEGKGKGKGLSQGFLLFGTAVLVVMLVFVAVNFIRDARIFEQPVLSLAGGNEGGKGAGPSAKPDDYKTIQYKKSKTGAKKTKPQSTPAAGNTQTPGQPTPTPASTPTPNP